MMKRCVQCEAEGAIHKTHAEIDLEVDRRRYETTVPAERCSACGEDFFHILVLQAFELAVAKRILDGGSVSGPEFKFVRKSLGLRATDLGELLGVAPETISRWETGGRAPDRNSLVVLGDLVEDRVAGRSTTLERLRAIDEPPPRPDGTVRIDLALDGLFAKSA
jgi:putative zinc finger/helix-turn-helix YgiT family protein